LKCLCIKHLEDQFHFFVKDRSKFDPLSRSFVRNSKEENYAIYSSSPKSGVLTGIILAISRIAGETAPLIMTMLGTTLFFTSLTGPVDARPLRIWRPASPMNLLMHLGGGCPCSDTPSPQHERTKKRI
jgi:hypothetical protein